MQREFGNRLKTNRRNNPSKHAIRSIQRGSTSMAKNAVFVCIGLLFTLIVPSFVGFLFQNDPSSKGLSSKNSIYLVQSYILGMSSEEIIQSDTENSQDFSSSELIPEKSYSLNPKAANETNVTSEPQAEDVFGFRACLPQDRFAFQNAPTISLNVTNSSFVAENTYYYSVFNYSQVNEEIIEKFSFNPLNEGDISLLNSLLESIWGSTLESNPIWVEFSGENIPEIQRLLLYEDRTAPSMDYGFAVNETTQTILVSNETELFNVPPNLYFKVYDNVNTTITLSYIINSQMIQEEIWVSKNIQDTAASALLNVSLSNVTDLWESIPDGDITLMFMLSDAAGNQGEWTQIHFQKDTESPVLESGNSNGAWLKIGEFSVMDHEDPRQGVFISRKAPTLEVNLKDTDIKTVGLVIHYNLKTLQAGLTADLPAIEIENDDRFYIPGVKEGAIWRIGIPTSIWDNFKNERINMDMEVRDFAGNIAAYSFSMVKFDESTFFTNTIESYLGIFFIVGIGIVIYASVSVLQRKRHGMQPISKLVYLEENSSKNSTHNSSITEDSLEIVDPELLDLILQPLNENEIDQLAKVLTDANIAYPSDHELESSLPSHNELSKIVQIVDFNEIHRLLLRFPMHQMNMEEFLREMYALSPEEREEFIEEYMEEYFEEDDDEEDTF